MTKLYDTLPDFQMQKTYAEISVGALLSNYAILRETARRQNRDARMIAVVKADAYGHTNEICVPALLSAGCDFFAVSSVEEAIAVRRIADRYGAHPDILILGFTFPEEAALLIRYDLIQALLSFDYARLLSEEAVRAGGRVRVHVKVDTGMNRVGFPVHSETETETAVREISAAVSLPGIQAEGLFAHFARADEPTPLGDALSSLQVSRFRTIDRELRFKGVVLPVRHISNSAAAVRFPDCSLECVRLGILLYGVRPSEEVGATVDGKRLTPVMTCKTLVSHLHTLLPGEGVGYGSTYRADTPRTIATLPIGYADGFLRAYRGSRVRVRTAAGEVTVPLVGRICMDQCMADVTGVPVSLFDEVTLFGGDDGSALSALAKKAGSIEYESLCAISARVPRVRTD